MQAVTLIQWFRAPPGWAAPLPDIIVDGRGWLWRAQVWFKLMKLLQAFKYELMPTGEQERAMRRFGGSCRFVYNKALALQMENHKANCKFIPYESMAGRLTHWRNSEEIRCSKANP